MQLVQFTLRLSDPSLERCRIRGSVDGRQQQRPAEFQYHGICGGFATVEFQYHGICGGFTTPEFQYHGTCGGFATAEFQYHGICGPLRETSIPVINLYYDLTTFPLGHRNVNSSIKFVLQFDENPAGSRKSRFQHSICTTS